jgi:hypothetical protein
MERFQMGFEPGIVSERTELMIATRDDRIALFTKLQNADTQPEFWARVAEDVDWTVEGTHPLAGRYLSKAEFVNATFTRLAQVLPGGVKLELKQLHVDGDTAIAELHSTSTTNEGPRSPMTIAGCVASTATSS